MQILPSVSQKDIRQEFWMSLGSQSELNASDSDFFSAMQDAMSAVSSGEEVSVNTAMKHDSSTASSTVADSTLSQPAPAPVLVDSPYNRHTDDGVTYTMDEVSFTKQELTELRQQLVKEGVPEEALEQFDILVGQPDGATLAQVLASLTVHKEISISDRDATTLTALLNKIDPSGDLSLLALQRMGEGRAEEAFTHIKHALARMDPQSTIQISRSDAQALGRALGLNKQNMQALMEHFSDHEVLEVNNAQFTRLFGSAALQFASDRAGRQKLDAALNKTLRPIVNRARERMEEARKASALESRTVEQSKVLINQTVEKDSRRTLDATLEQGQKEAPVAVDKAEQKMTAADKPVPQTESIPGSRLPMPEEKTARASAFADKAQSAVQMQTAENQSAFHAEQDMAQGQGYEQHFEQHNGQSNNGRNSGWSELLGKTEVRSTAPQHTNTGSVLFSMLQGGQNVQDLSLQGNVTQSRHISRQVAQQVERSMLSAMRNGGTRMDLQLNPVELGTLNITLTARNGEVSALIRSERSETAEMITRQMDMIRTNLEQQGIKVDKIEVQLQSQNENSSSQWENLDQHNSWQEEDSRREELARLKNLATIRNSRENIKESTLEQPVHTMEQTARSATQSLHVVA